MVQDGTRWNYMNYCDAVAKQLHVDCHRPKAKAKVPVTCKQTHTDRMKDSRLTEVLVSVVIASIYALSNIIR